MCTASCSVRLRCFTWRRSPRRSSCLCATRTSVSSASRAYVPTARGCGDSKVRTSRIHDNFETLNRPTFLAELAKTTMRKLTPEPFLFFSRIEYSTICSQGLVWDKVSCRERRNATFRQQGAAAVVGRAGTLRAHSHGPRGAGVERA
jgi:hypothetical protein